MMTPRTSAFRVRPGASGRTNRSSVRRLTVVECEPSVERMPVLTRTLVCVLAAALTAAIGLSLAGLAGTARGWAVLAAAALAGLTPLAWHWRRARQPGRLAVWDLEPRLARLVGEAAAEADVLRRLADRAPAGPVADHLDHLASTAHQHVVALHQAAVHSTLSGAGTPGQRDVELEATMTRIVAQLADLSAAAGRLREAQRRHLQSSPLEDLTEATDALTAAVESGTLP